MENAPFRRVFRKPAAANAAQLDRLRAALTDAVRAQSRFADAAPGCLRYLGQLQEDDHSFFVSHEPAVAMLPADVYDQSLPHMPLPELLELLHSVSLVIAAAHDVKPVGIVHGGLHPACVLRGMDGDVRVADFNVAAAYCKAISPDLYSSLTVQIPRPGTEGGATGIWDSPGWGELRDDRLLPFIAPEKLAEQTLDVFTKSADAYALGVIAYLLAERCHPYIDTNDLSDCPHRYTWFRDELTMKQPNALRRATWLRASEALPSGARALIEQLVRDTAGTRPSFDQISKRAAELLRLATPVRPPAEPRKPSPPDKPTPVGSPGPQGAAESKVAAPAAAEPSKPAKPKTQQPTKADSPKPPAEAATEKPVDAPPPQPVPPASPAPAAPPEKPGEPGVERPPNKKPAERPDQTAAPSKSDTPERKEKKERKRATVAATAPPPDVPPPDAPPPAAPPPGVPTPIVPEKRARDVSTSSTPADPSVAGGSSRRGLLIGGAAAAVLLSGGLAWLTLFPSRRTNANQNANIAQNSSTTLPENRNASPNANAPENLNSPLNASAGNANRSGPPGGGATANANTPLQTDVDRSNANRLANANTNADPVTNANANAAVVVVPWPDLNTCKLPEYLAGYRRWTAGGPAERADANAMVRSEYELLDALNQSGEAGRWSVHPELPATVVIADREYSPVKITGGPVALVYYVARDARPSTGPGDVVPQIRSLRDATPLLRRLGPRCGLPTAGEWQSIARAWFGARRDARDRSWVELCWEEREWCLRDGVKWSDPAAESSDNLRVIGGVTLAAMGRGRGRTARQVPSLSETATSLDEWLASPLARARDAGDLTGDQAPAIRPVLRIWPLRDR